MPRFQSTSQNPKYSPLEDHRFVESAARRSNSVVVRIWAGYNGSDFFPLLEWRVELCCLRYIGKELRDIPAGLPNNTILFKLENGFYTAPDEDDMIEHPHTSTMEVLAQVPGTGVRRSYTYDSVMRLNNLHECIEDTKKSRDEIKHNIELALTKENAPMIMHKRRGEYVERLSHLRRQVGLGEKELDTVQRKAAAMRQEQARRRKALEDSRERGQTQEMYLEENMINLAKNKESLFLVLKEYTTKRIELIATLFTIFPITESEKDPNLLKICNVPLPNSVYLGMDEEAIAVALGFACHLVTMLAHYLAVPLRYPLTPMGARAFVVDPISILVGPREFPLYGKGQDKFRFEYGVFLFNKNIDQLLNSQGLQFMDLRQTLPNLRYLMEALLTTSPTQSMLYRSKYLSRKKQDRLSQDRLNDLFIISLEQREFDHILNPVIDTSADDGDNDINSTAVGKRNRERLPSATQPINNEHSLLAREYDPIDGEYTIILNNTPMRSPKSQKEASGNDISTYESCGPRSTPTSPRGAHENVRSSLRHDYSSSLNLSSSDDDGNSTSESQYQTWAGVEHMNEIKQGSVDVDAKETRSPFDSKISKLNSDRGRPNTIENMVTGDCRSRLSSMEGGSFVNSIITRGDHSTSRPTHDDLPTSLTKLSIHNVIDRQVNSYTETDLGDSIVPPSILQSPPPSISISSAILSKEPSQVNVVERSFQEPRRIKSDSQHSQQPMEDGHPYVGVRSVKSLDSVRGNQHPRGHRVSNKVGVDTGDGELINSKQMIHAHEQQSPTATTSGILETSS
ncbi:hypothetical protein BGZ51_006250 [Haplosporangium sp. Z 767]|nr:hypothetical protein BGZ50_001943 [Haplosporangium sp. Z 11]KAF9192058.1 hypothetical protein BGZ51_006250 [Haplosporangium sp. Z 767]